MRIIHDNNYKSVPIKTLRPNTAYVRWASGSGVKVFGIRMKGEGPRPGFKEVAAIEWRGPHMDTAEVCTIKETTKVSIVDATITYEYREGV